MVVECITCATYINTNCRATYMNTNYHWLYINTNCRATYINTNYHSLYINTNCVCWLFIFKVTEPNSIPYRTHPACAKRAAYPDPPPVIPVPDTGVAEVTHLPSPRSLGEPRPNRLSSEPGSVSGPKCFQVLGLSPSLLQNPML